MFSKPEPVQIGCCYVHHREVFKRNFIVIGRGKRVESRLTIKNCGEWQRYGASHETKGRQRLPSRALYVVAAMNSRNPA